MVVRRVRVGCKRGVHRLLLVGWVCCKLQPVMVHCSWVHCSPSSSVPAHACPPSQSPISFVLPVSLNPQPHSSFLSLSTPPPPNLAPREGLPQKIKADTEGGRLVFFGHTDIGMLNNVVELWRYPSAQVSEWMMRIRCCWVIIRLFPCSCRASKPRRGVN